MNVNPTPKFEFVQNPQFVKEHREMIQQPVFRRAVSTALAQYHLALASSMDKDMNAAAASGIRHLAAEEFAGVLISLAETPDEKKTVSQTPNLGGNSASRNN